MLLANDPFLDGRNIDLLLSCFDNVGASPSVPDDGSRKALPRLELLLTVRSRSRRRGSPGPFGSCSCWSWSPAADEAGRVGKLVSRSRGDPPSREDERAALGGADEFEAVEAVLVVDEAKSGLTGAMLGRSRDPAGRSAERESSLDARSGIEELPLIDRAGCAPRGLVDGRRSLCWSW